MRDNDPLPWHPLAQAPRLMPEAVHVIRIGLRGGASRAERLRPLLEPGERERADRFYFDRDRLAYTITRASLRLLLGGSLGLDPRELRFGYNPRGKPFLERADDAGKVQFNVSHSHELALIALAAGRDVGVDVEWIRPHIAEELLSERFFSLREAAALRVLPAADRPQAFFACWTRKEAFIKALGAGLSLPLDSFDVSLGPDEPPALLAVRSPVPADASWRLCALDPGPGYAGALVAQGQGWTLHCWDLLDE